MKRTGPPRIFATYAEAAQGKILLRIAAAIVLLQGLCIFPAVAGNDGALLLTLFAILPQLLLLGVWIAARNPFWKLAVPPLLVLFWLLGFAAFVSGADLILIFLPLYQFLLLLVIGLLLFLAGTVYVLASSLAGLFRRLRG